MYYWLDFLTKEAGSFEESADDQKSIAQAVIDEFQDDGDSCTVIRCSLSNTQPILKIRYSMGDFRISQLVKRLDQKWLQSLIAEFEELGACVVEDENEV